MKKLGYDYFVLLAFIALLVKAILSPISNAEAAIMLGSLVFFAVRMQINYKKELLEESYLQKVTELDAKIESYSKNVEASMIELVTKVSSAESKLNLNSIARSLRPGSQNEK